MSQEERRPRLAGVSSKLMRRRNNNNNDNPNTDGTPILDECWRIISNSQEEEEGYKIAALHIALDGNADCRDAKECERTVLSGCY